MLRHALITIAVLMSVVGVVLLGAGVPSPGWNLLVMGAVLLLALLFERWRYRGAASGSGRWHPTEERFVDPESGEVMEVQFDPATGQRRYVKRAAGAQPPQAG